jgi:hypothetical protein
MLTAWLADVKNDDAALKQRKADIKAAKDAFARLDTILKDKEDAALQQMLAKESFTHASWPFEQAALVAEVKTLRSLRELISPDKGTKE